MELARVRKHSPAPSLTKLQILKLGGDTSDLYMTQESCCENDFTLSDTQLQPAMVLDVIGSF